MHLFAYGTLIAPEIWRLVAGRDDAGAAALVRGYLIRRVRDDSYPVMLRSPVEGEIVRGVVYFNVAASIWLRLDEYESPIYERIDVAAELVGGDAVKCQAYVVPDSRAELASDDGWDFDAFSRNDLNDYLSRF
jgi:gamma-glutamylcyclotransferase (GGCT)/AIG2-like uncharacterized protein YtfP